MSEAQVTAAKDYTDKELVQTLIEVYARSCMYQTKVLHDRWRELHEEADKRFEELRAAADPDVMEAYRDGVRGGLTRAAEIMGKRGLDARRRELLIEATKYSSQSASSTTTKGQS